MVCRSCGIPIKVAKTGLCRKHYIENSPHIGAKGSDANNWKGGVWVHQGYIAIRNTEHPFAKSNGYIFEHRLVMESKIGRYLSPEEVVHHINGVKTDNRIENLELISNNSKHIKGDRHFWRSKRCSVCKCKHAAKGFCKTHYWYFILKIHRNIDKPKKYTFYQPSKILCQCEKLTSI